MNKQVKLTSQILEMSEDKVEKNIRVFYELIFQTIKEAQISNEIYDNIKIPKFGKFAIKPMRLKHTKYRELELKISTQNMSTGF